ncbi:MAG: hypothetical protein AABX24_01955 [Nanoarchaeota archaeon]
MNKINQMNQMNKIGEKGRMDKKGITTLMMILEIIIILIAAYSIFSIASKYASSETTNKIIIADDLKMMVDTLIGTPGETVVQYPGNVSKYTFILSSSSVSVFIKGEGEQKKIMRYFSLPAGYQAFGTLESKDNLCLEKEKNKIMLRECIKTAVAEKAAIQGKVSPAALSGSETKSSVPCAGVQLDQAKSFEYSGLSEGRKYYLDSSKKGIFRGFVTALSNKEGYYACATEDQCDCRWFQPDNKLAKSATVELESGFGELDGKFCFLSVGGSNVPKRCATTVDGLGEKFDYKYRNEEPEMYFYAASYKADPTKTGTQIDANGNEIRKAVYACNVQGPEGACIWFRDYFTTLAHQVIRFDSGFGELDGKYCKLSGIAALRYPGATIQPLQPDKCKGSFTEAFQISMWPPLSAAEKSYLGSISDESVTPEGEITSMGQIVWGSSSGSDAKAWTNLGETIWLNLLNYKFTDVVYVTSGQNANKFILVKDGQYVSDSERDSQLEVEAQYDALIALTRPTLIERSYVPED